MRIDQTEFRFKENGRASLMLVNWLAGYGVETAADLYRDMGSEVEVEQNHPVGRKCLAQLKQILAEYDLPALPRYRDRPGVARDDMRPSFVQVNFRLPQVLKDEIDASAARNGRSITAELVSRLEQREANEMKPAFERIRAELDAVEMACLNRVGRAEEKVPFVRDALREIIRLAGSGEKDALSLIVETAEQALSFTKKD